MRLDDRVRQDMSGGDDTQHEPGAQHEMTRYLGEEGPSLSRGKPGKNP